ncbi:MAG: hypothetical protein JGK12_05795 [Microcoleus sp. PH2017_01_SCD_O_A]|uniref:hypothetical protein n=3 Tax=Microcoleus TaxID=44471 RepID=UPI001D5F6FD6|nr:MULTISPECIES: hypothetical protein [unclassified Microcoleus]MCC3423443.1 hypothetical protein [Microcoleus sp. PH2017_01_SCD_O_A]MCC3439787.1 hypothetical protein [Microcoleus sp. PH2017_05_CCC_O_A]TAG13228.1 MAG: hypothetical protein EAZ39_28855 [Oscillatoriales cyanobacterium]TAG64883.1 MAG: hypothetical protein EAZ25_18220 [Oscillatoriales cyanobacterium]
MGELIDLNRKTITDADLPATTATDAEVAQAIAAHEAKTDPHPSLWARIVAGFLSLAGGQRILKNNPPITYTSFFGGSNHLELTTDNGSNPILAFHKGGISAVSLYHFGYGNELLRLQSADGLNAALIHDGNIGTKTAGNANGLMLDGGVAIKTRLIEGTTAAEQGLGVNIAHGLDPAKIVSVQVIVRATSGAIVQANNLNGLGATRHRFDWAVIGANLFITNVADQSASLVSRPFSALITYRS